MKRARHLLAAASLSASIALVWGLIATALLTAANDYLALGFLRSIAFILADRLGGILAPALVIAAAGCIVLLASSEARARGLLDAMPGLLAAAAGAGLVLHLAIDYNLNHFSKQWSRSGELFRLEMPLALFKWNVLATDLAFLAALMLVAFLVRRLVDHGCRRLGISGARLWHRLGQPAVALPLLGLTLVPALVAWAVRPALPYAPSFIVISLDTLRADHLGCYGYGRDTSPSLDALAAEGYRFEWAISQAPRTDLSHMSLFTALYPSVHGVAAPRALQPARLTLAERLRERGYRTAGFTDGGYLRPGLGFAQGFERYDALRPVGFAENAERFLEWQTGLSSAAPFFAFLHTYEVHFPYKAAPTWRDRYVDPAYDGLFADDLEAWKRIGAADRGQPHASSAPTPRDIEYVKARYDAGLRWVDSLVGDLVTELQRRGLLETTWLIVTSDHGEEFLEHDRIFHNVVYHTVSRVPLIMRPPGGAEAPRPIPEVVELIDVAPTLWQLSDLETPNGVDGRSLLPLIRGTSTSWPGLGFSEAPFREDWHRGLTTESLHLLVNSAAEGYEAFDYRADPLEQSPLAPGERQEEVAAAVRLLAEWSRKVGGPGSSDPDPTAVLNPETEKQLRALGYVD